MRYKKLIMSVTATATIAASFIGAGTAEAAAYKVKKGDTLYSIAQKNKTTVSNLKTVNKLKNNNIKVGQVLQTTKTAAKSTKKTTKKVAKAPAAKTASTKVHTVKKGETLYRIATNNGISVNTLKAWNGLKSNNIKVGQKLTVKGGKAVKSSAVKQTSNNVSSAGYDVDKLIDVAKAQLGTPYVFGGSRPGGFDCSGYISYVYNQAGKSIGRTSAAGFYGKASAVSSPEVGDLVFFAGTYKSGISHVGIYIGGNQFIHAGGNKVQITSLSNSYWKSHFHSYKRFN